MALNFQDRLPASLKRVLLGVFVVLSIVLMVAYGYEGSTGPLHSLQSGFSGITSPLQRAGATLGAAGESAGQSLDNATASEETLSALREQNQQLTNLVAQTEEYRQEVERLQGLLNMKETYGIEGVTAHVIGRSSEAWNQTVTLDVGESGGADAGLTVMGPYGVVGQIVSTTQSTSVVRLLTDPKSGAAAVVQATRQEGVVRGSLDGLLYLENVDVDAVVNAGDLVLTSGMGGSYTSGLLIGTIVKVEGKVGDASRRIVVSPNETTSVLEEVIIVNSAATATSDNKTSGGAN